MNRRAPELLATVSLALALQLGAALSARAGSRVVEVTPENIASQEVNLRVETESYDNDTIDFRVFVSPGASALSPACEGRLEIAPEGPAREEGGLQLHPMLWCRVREVRQDGVVEYGFGLPRQWLSRATFAFRNYHPSMPSMVAYVLPLERFAPSESATPSRSRFQVAYDVEPELVSMGDPEYPESAKKQGAEGTVLVRVLVGEDGRVQDFIIIQSVPLLDASAVAVATTAVFKPALKDDRPVAVWMVVPVEYRLHH